MKRHVLLEDQDRPLIWFDERPRITWRVILECVAYGLAAVAIVGIVWLAASVYIIAGTPA